VFSRARALNDDLGALLRKLPERGISFPAVAVRRFAGTTVHPSPQQRNVQRGYFRTKAQSPRETETEREREREREREGGKGEARPLSRADGNN